MGKPLITIQALTPVPVFQGFQREQFAWAGGCLDVSVSEDLVCGDRVGYFEVLDQSSQRVELFGGGWLILEVSDQCDPDTVLVMGLITGVGSVQLVSPAKGRLDASVGHTLAVADHEVVADSEPRLAVGLTSKMIGVDRGDAAGFGCGVMQYDRIPASRRFFG
jgi:hypothetical protein